MVTRRSTRTCREGWCYLLLLAAVFGWAMLRQENLLLAVAAMMIGPVLLSRRLAAGSLRGLQVRRSVPDAVHAGQPLVIHVELSSTRRRLGSWAVTVEDRVCPQTDSGGDEPLRPTALFGYVPAGGSHRQAYRGRLSRRGKYRLGPLEVASRFPFGLFRHAVAFDQTVTLTVLPRLGRLSPGWLRRHYEAPVGTGRGERRPGRLADEFYGVRQWQSGDSLRWIHWRSSARHGNLVVRQFEQQRNRDTALVVDLWQPSRPDADALDNVELAVSFAATVVADVCRRGGGHLWLAVAGGEPDCIGGWASVALRQRAMERLAVAAASSEDRLPALIASALHETQPDTDVVLVSTREVDLTDRQRFGVLWDDPARARAASRLQVVNTADHRLARYFQLLP